MFKATGRLAEWTCAPALDKITVPVLLVSGKWDAERPFTIAPFFRLLSKVKWIELQNSSHTPHFEEREVFFQILDDFLRD